MVIPSLEASWISRAAHPDPREPAGVSGRLETLGRELATIGGRVDSTAERLAGQAEPLADELRSRPGHLDIQDILAKIVDAVQSDVATQLGSLEETVLTLAEALLRPGGRPAVRPEVRPEVRIQERVELRSRRPGTAPRSSARWGHQVQPAPGA
ncbi:MAG TPA: hypothetical protein VFV73_37175 [Streptosporangiaceae bacterium]|nr:hypothetical protein [Streptosporangiaceae bacterium]